MENGGLASPTNSGYTKGDSSKAVKIPSQVKGSLNRKNSGNYQDNN